MPKSGKWGEGDEQFMLHLYQKASDKQKEDFLGKVLEPLFFEALNGDRSGGKDLFDTKVLGVSRTLLNAKSIDYDTAITESTFALPMNVEWLDHTRKALAGLAAELPMGEFAGIFASLGCVQAFNLDGGGSTSMMFASDFINRPSTSGQRDMPDIILIKEIEPVSAESLS